MDLPSAVHLDTPYTIQPGGCGDPGEYIHVTRNYILNLEGQSTALFGPPGKSNRMKHEISRITILIFKSSFYF